MDSREAVLGALANDLDGVELDVQLTADGVLVAFHDLDLHSKTGCSGPIHSHTWEQLKACPNLERLDHPYPIQRLDSLLLEAAGTFPRSEFTFDIKLNTKSEWWPYLQAFSTAINDVAMRPELKNRILIECQTDDFLRSIHDKAPDLPLFYYASDPGTAMDRALSLGCSGITMDSDLLSPTDVALAQERGLQVTLFGVSGYWDLRNAAHKKPDRIQLDHDR